MAELVAYEIQTFNDGQWKIDSVYDDQDLAVYEAGRIASGQRFAAVRVVEERFDDENNRIKNRTVFRSSRANRERAAPASAKKATSEKAAGEPAPPREAGANSKRAKPRPKSSGMSPVVLTLTFGGIVLLGLGLIVGLRYLAATV